MKRHGVLRSIMGVGIVGSFFFLAGRLAAQPGADVPFITYEAEGAGVTTNGNIVRMTPLPGNDEVMNAPEIEASGRAYVELSGVGQYVDIPVQARANTFVVRFCIPDAPLGGGITATLSLYVGSEHRQDILLNSRNAWLYRSPIISTVTPRVNNPYDGRFLATPGIPSAFWDEAYGFIQGGVEAGQRLRLQVDGGDTATYYRIDLVDLEQVAPIATPPVGTYLSAVDYGANGTDQVDDYAAIRSCINAAVAQNKTAWIPPGTYYQTKSLRVDGAKVQGAGMWYTVLVGTDPLGSLGFDLGGAGVEVKDVRIECSWRTDREAEGSGGVGNFNVSGAPKLISNGLLERLWIVHTSVGIWLREMESTTIRGVRVRATYADGINIGRRANNCVVEHCHLRGTGDDSLAVLAPIESATFPSNNIFRNNTVVAPWSGANVDIAGGTGHIVENNLLQDGSPSGTLSINLPTSFPMHPATGIVIRENRIERGGGNVGGQKRGAIWMLPAFNTITGVLVQDNDVVDPLFRGIHLAGGKTLETRFERNRISNPGEEAAFIAGQSVGKAEFVDNDIVNLKPGITVLRNDATSSFTAVVSSPQVSWVTPTSGARLVAPLSVLAEGRAGLGVGEGWFLVNGTTQATQTHAPYTWVYSPGDRDGPVTLGVRVKGLIGDYGLGTVVVQVGLSPPAQGVLTPRGLHSLGARWDSSDQATKYVLVASPRQSTVVVSSLTVTGTSATLVGLDSDTAYEVMAKACNEIRCSPFGSLGFSRTWAPVSEEVGTLRVFPNVLNKGRGVWEATIDRVPPETNLRIFSMQGHLVRQWKSDENGRAVWDARDDGGNLVGSGVYFLLAEKEGSETTAKIIVKK